MPSSINDDETYKRLREREVSLGKQKLKLMRSLATLAGARQAMENLSPDLEKARKDVFDYTYLFNNYNE